MEENRGIALRPLLSELAAELRAGAPGAARGLSIELDLETIYTTQDVAVSVAFLITEIVEFAMLHRPEEPVEMSLRRTSELTARLTLSSPVLVPDEADEREKVSSNGSSAGWPSNCARRSSASSAATALICRSFRRLKRNRRSLRRREKNFRKRRNRSRTRDVKHSDSDLLPPRSRYPIKWARNRQPSPPPVAFPGPHLSGALSHQPKLSRRRACARARQWVRRIARIANSYRP